MSNISQRIDSIIQIRNSRVDSVDKAIENLDGCIAAVRRLEAARADCISGRLELEPEIAERIKSISPGNFYTSANAYREKLMKLKDRFSRKNLHISLVGRARMGKSLVIQKITGLDGSIIPSADGTDCTGTKSTITNSDSPDVRAEITFYSEYEMVGIINTYLEKILHDKSMNISAVSQIASLDVGSIKLDYSQVQENQYLAHLKKYVANIGAFIGDLGDTKNAPKDEIEKYVAQYSSRDFETKYYNYLGVKNANIITRFPYNDAGKIVLLDTIGIGTTSLGVEDSMLEIVENDSDAIVFMFRPDSLGPRVSDDEIKVIDMITKRVGAEYAKEMLFWVINEVVSGKGKNTEYIQGVLDQINSSSFPVSEVLQVDCSNAEMVEQKLLLPVLEKISSRIAEVDRLIVEKARADGQRAYAEFTAIAAAVDSLFCNYSSKEIDRVLEPRCVTVRDEKMKNGLREKYQEYDKLRNEPCERFKDAYEKIMRQMFDFVPSTEDVVGILNRGKNQFDTLMICYDRLRLDIIDAFLTLDIDLNELILDMKNEVLDIFRSPENGRLELLVIADEANRNPDNWISAFLEKTEAFEEYNIIAGAFDKFREFRCTVQGFLIHEIRNRLDCINQELQENLRIDHDLTDKPGVAEDIIEKLKDSVSDIHGELRYVLDSMAQIPNQAMCAAIKDLFDRAFLENRPAMGEEDSETQWRYLLMHWKHILWKEDFERLMSAQNRGKALGSIIDSIKKFNKQAYFEIAL